MRVFSKLLVALLIILGLTSPLSALAFGIPFGGKVVGITPCMNGGILEVILGVKGGKFIWRPGTLTYLYGQIRAGVNQIGLTDPGEVRCVISVSPPVEISAPMIRMVGTSLSI